MIIIEFNWINVCSFSYILVFDFISLNYSFPFNFSFCQAVFSITFYYLTRYNGFSMEAIISGLVSLRWVTSFKYWTEYLTKLSSYSKQKILSYDEYKKVPFKKKMDIFLFREQSNILDAKKKIPYASIFKYIIRLRHRLDILLLRAFY